MLKVAIIEDEPMILRNLALFVQRLDPDFSQVSQFSYGSDFLKYADANSPDIVISDIRLPDMIGTELLKHCKRTNPNVKFIIISAYKNFEYAQSAIEFKADAYLTKPIDRAALSHTLMSLKEELSKNISYHYNRSVNELLRAILTKCAGKQFKDREELRHELEQSNILSTASNHIFTAYISANNLASVSVKHLCDSDYIMASLSNFILMPDFSSSGICIHKGASMDNMLELYISVPAPRDGKTELRRIAEEHLAPINSACVEYLGFSFNHTIICEYADIYRFFEKKPHVFTDIRLSEFELFADFSIASMVMHCCESNEREYADAIDRICKFLAAAESEGSAHYAQFCSLLTEKLIAGFKTFAPYADELTFSGSFPESFRAECGKLFERHCKSQGGRSLLAEMAMQYIKDNISSQSLTLSDISNSCYTHPVYLSRVFKQTYDMTIHQCITTHRIIKAKDMLRRGVSLDETSYACGYKTVKYFSKIFKQVTGESPSKYKKRWNA